MLALPLKAQTKPLHMKRTITKLLVAACCLTATSTFAQLLTPELLYYKWDGTGTNVPNYASAPPVGTTNATLMGGLTQGTGGSPLCTGSVIGSGISSGTDYVNTGYATNLTSAASWTISFRTSGVTASATLFYIFGDAGANSFRCFTNGVAGPNNWWLRGTGLTDVPLNGGATVAPHMCTFVYDATLANVKAYLDGVLVNTVAQGAFSFVSPGPMKVIGYGTNVGMPAGGQMDEFRLYSRALTAAEITQLYNPWTPSGFLGSNITFCGSAPATISLPNWPYSAALWSNGSTFDTAQIQSSGQVSVSVTGACGAGMDTVALTILAPTASTITATTCNMDYTTPSGALLTTTGMYMDTIPNIVGCDSVITINYTRNMPSSNTMSVSSCNTYTAPSGAVYTTSGTVMDTIPNAVGCDSVMTINLTVNSSTQSSFAVTACDMYTTPSGAMVMSSGTVMDTIANMSGCDSVMTISVTINMSTTSTTSASACDMYTAPSGATYMMSGTYMDTIANMAGCDSVITINLTITNSTTGTLTAQACDSYTAPSGAVLTSTGTYMDTIPNMAGCDSVITINLMIMNSSTASMSASTCGGPFTAPSGATYTTSGTYMDTIPNMMGCDSVITITLTVTTINAGAIVSGATCTATGLGSSFQWLDCNGMTPIAGATANVYTATANGSYCVVITNGNCVDTSGCVTVTGIGIEENAFASSITLYPNPNSGNFTINLGNTYSDVTVVITDLAGRVVYSHIENSTNMIPVQLDAAAGVYVVIVTSGENRATFRINKD